KVESETNFLQSLLAQRMAELRFFLFHVKDQESTSASADQLATQCTIGSRQVVPTINFRIRHAPAPNSLTFPMPIHQRGILAQVSRLECTKALETEILDEM